MAFFHQLRLLLWKNFTLKKRAPYILCLELIVPLILFLILVSIRNHRHPYRRFEQSWHPDALPSAGIVPLLQSFCGSGYIIDKNGYKSYPNASITTILADVADISNTPVFNAIVDLKELQTDFDDFSQDERYSKQSREIKDFNFSDIFSRTKSFKRFLVTNLSMPETLANDLVMTSFNGSEISQILLEKNSNLFDKYIHEIQYNGVPSSETFKELQKSVVFEALFDPTSFLSGPSWLRLLFAASNVPGVLTNGTNFDELELFFVNEYLSGEEIHNISCNQDIFDRLIILENNSSSEKIELQRFLCGLNKNQTVALTNEMKTTFNWSNLVEKLRVNGPTMEEFNKRAERIQKDLTKIENLQDAIKKLTKLANDLQLNLTNIDNRKNETRPTLLKQNANDIWYVLSPVLCGRHPKSDVSSKLPDKDSTIQDLFQGQGKSTHALMIMLYTLTNDPMILYSPNGTEADDVMKKSGHFLELMKTTREMGQKWLSVSKDFQEYLKQNSTQIFLKEMLISVDKFPFMYDSYLNISYEIYMKTPEKLKKYLLNHNVTISKYLNLTRTTSKHVIEKLIIKDDENNDLLKQLDSVDYLAKGWDAVLEPMKLDIFYGFPNETAMIHFISNVTAPTRAHKPVLSAVVFDNIQKNGKLPKHIIYRIRMDGRLLHSTQEVRSRYWFPGPLSGDSKYFYFGFAWMQDQLERAMIDVLTGKNITSPGLYTQMMPYPCYLKDNFMFVIQYIMPLCVVVSFIYSVAILVQSIVYEKEQRLKEVMKMMGLSNAVHWMAWFITSAVTMMAIVILLTIILKVGGILQYSNPAIVLLFLTLAALATTNFCFLISIFFSKAKLAAACGGIIYFVTYMPYVFISVQEGGSSHMDISSTYKTLASLLSTTAFGLGARYFALFEQNGVGVQWSNIASSPLENDHFNLAQVFTMLIVDTFLYAILVWYIEAIHPGTYGIPRPWYFPFQFSFWFGPQCTTGFEFDCFKSYQRVNRLNSTATMDPPNTPALLAVEAEPVHLTLGVGIDNLVKVYKKGSLPAVDHLSLNLYEGQITSFLGHNGAGKTTTMSLLTGLFPSTSGTAYIYGNDIHTDMDKIRTSLGLCPQHNVLYSKFVTYLPNRYFEEHLWRDASENLTNYINKDMRLTVEEHLWLYARLKGMPENQVLEETNRFLEDVGLPEKRNCPVDTLSGGMKRKLSVAMAFVGGSRTVILDEPTAGVDPYARRAIWELLAKYKDGRTILLSTHFMDEADILGDRIAIISHGKLRCCGSSLFLKTKFGDGYHLTLVRDTNRDKDSKNVSVDAITKFIKDFIPSADLICKSQYELSYILPDKGKERKATLKQLFDNLEKNKEKLQCKSFGLQDTTLEEVFLKVTEATVAGEEDITNELTTTVNTLPTNDDNSSINTTTIQLDDIITTTSSPSNSPSPVSTCTASSLNSTPTKSLIGSEKRPGHRRSFSHDIVESKLALARRHKQPHCVHRRTPSGGFTGHRRALSSDLTFMLTRNDTNTPETIRKVSKHKRVPSGAAKIQPLGSEAWEIHAGGTHTVNSNIQRWQQFYGLLIKRFHHSRRNLKAFLTHIFLPGIFISIAMTVALSQPKADTYPPLILSPSMFHPSPYYIPFSNSKRTGMAKKMEDTLLLPSGIGSDCVLKTSGGFRNKSIEFLHNNLSGYFNDFCIKHIEKSNEDIKFMRARRLNTTQSRKPSNLTCHCVGANMEYECDAGIGQDLDMFTTVTMDTMVNVSNEDMSNYLLHTNFAFKRKRYGGLTFGDEQTVVPKKIQDSSLLDVKKLFVRDTARVWFSNKGYHSMPTFINAMDNAILRASITPDMGNPAEYGITAITHPLNFTRNVLNLNSIKQGTDAIIAIFVIIAMSFVPASFVVFLVMERTTKAKHIQFVSGVNPILYWLSNYVWDLFNFMIPIMACLVIFHIFNVPAYSSRTNFPAVCALFICYGWSITPMMYPASFLFREASTAYVVLILLNLFLGITCTVTTSILQLFPNDPQLRLAFEIVRTGSLIFPNYCLGRGLMDLAYNELMNMVHIQIGQFDEIRSPFEWDIVLRSCVCMVSEGVLFFIITLIIEYKSSIRRKTVTLMDNSSDGDDIDVANEKQRVLSGGAEEDLLRIENLTKIYNSKKTGKHLAVNRLTVGVAKGECFGLLGVNGAGKTTTFKMLTGDSHITAGDAYVENNSVVRNLLHVHKLIGYCPQFDALIDHLTAEEHLYFYARLKGIPELEIKKVVNWLIKKMALTRYASKTSKTYSGGNKRKLSAAIALIGNPKVIFMDEPTTGMDPGARRFLWNVILSIVKQGTRSVVLTSHSMEECEALCTKLAIMVNGQFQCLGSTQHIKDRFGDGYIVTIRVKGSLPNMGPIMNFMMESFHHCVLKESHHNVVQYQVGSSENMSLADIFKKMETACKELEIEDYSVSQTSLDNVFVNFAKHQTDNVLENDPSFVYAKRKTKLKSIQTRLHKLLTSRKRRKREENPSFTHLVQLPHERTETIGSIGDDEEEVALTEIDTYLFPQERTRLTFDI